MALDEDLRTVLVAVINNAAVPVEQGKITDTAGQPRVWYRRANGNTDLFIGGQKGLTETRYDVEVHGTAIGTVQSIGDTIKAHYGDGGLNGKSGTFGSSSVLGCFVEDHSDDYEPKGTLDSDVGMHVVALDVLIIQE